MRKVALINNHIIDTYLLTVYSIFVRWNIHCDEQVYQYVYQQYNNILIVIRNGIQNVFFKFCVIHGNFGK